MRFPIIWAFGKKSQDGTYEWTYVDRLSFEQCMNLIRAGFYVSQRDETGIWSCLSQHETGE
jgi:hypothetical protein